MDFNEDLIPICSPMKIAGLLNCGGTLAEYRMRGAMVRNLSLNFLQQPKAPYEAAIESLPAMHLLNPPGTEA